MFIKILIVVTFIWANLVDAGKNLYLFVYLFKRIKLIK